MTNPLAEVAIKTGLISPDALAEAKRWNPGLEIPENVPAEPVSLEEASEAIRDVLESPDAVTVRETDLAILERYLSTQRTGALYVEDESTGVATSFPVMFGMNMRGEYILPYRGDNIRDLLANGRSYLEFSDETLTYRFYFKDVREVFYGNVKAFVVCSASFSDAAPVLAEPAEGNDGDG